jgi:hypothetical protein
MLFFIELINTSDAVPPQKNCWSTKPICRHQLKPLTLKGKLKERLATVLYGNSNLYNRVDRKVQVKAEPPEILISKNNCI